MAAPASLATLGGGGTGKLARPRWPEPGLGLAFNA
jgi:hypothetical protein